MNQASVERADWVRLLSNLSISWTLALEIIIRAIDDPDEPHGRILEAADAVMAAPPEIVILGNPALWERFKALRRLALLLFTEMNRRIEKLRGGSEVGQLILPPSPMVDLPIFMQAIQAERLVAYPGTEFRRRPDGEPGWVLGRVESADEDADFQQEAVQGLLKRYQKLTKVYADRVPIHLDLPSRRHLGLADLPDGRWGDWNAFHRAKLVRVLSKFGTLEQVDKLIDSGWQNVREHRRKGRAAKRRPSRGFAPLDDLIVDPTGGSPARTLELKESQSRIVYLMRARVGARAAKYAQARLDRASPEEAAAEASVGERQARRYERRLKDIFVEARK